MEKILWQSEGVRYTFTRDSTYMELVRVITHPILDMIIKEYSMYTGLYALGQTMRKEMIEKGYRGTFTQEYDRRMRENIWGPIELWIGAQGNLIVLEE